MEPTVKLPRVDCSPEFVSALSAMAAERQPAIKDHSSSIYGVSCITVGSHLARGAARRRRLWQSPRQAFGPRRGEL